MRPWSRGFIHYECATDYVKAKHGNLACEVCLEEMTNLEVGLYKLIQSTHSLQAHGFNPC